MQGAPWARGGGGFAGISRPDGAWTHSSLRAARGAVCRSGGQVSHERSFIKAPLGLSVMPGWPRGMPPPPRRRPAHSPASTHRGSSPPHASERSTLAARQSADSICAHRRRQLGRCCPRRSREIDRGRWREGRGGLAARGRAGSPPHVWCTASAKSPPAELAVHPFVAEWLRQVPGGAEQQQPALSGRSQGCCPPLQRGLGPARPAPSPARPSAGRLDGSRSCIVQRAEAQPAASGRAGGSQRWLRRRSGRA